MGLLDMAVGIADKVTQSLGLQASVMHTSITSLDGDGNPLAPPPAVKRSAVVVKKQQLVKTSDGQLVMSQASVTFLNPTVINLTDKIVLPDGTTGPILNTEGFVAVTNPILTQVYLG